MNVNHAISRRRLGMSKRIEIDFAVDRMRLKEAIRLTTSDQELEIKTFGPLACTKLSNGIVAVANEDGSVNLVSTKNLKNLDHWIGHNNAIFDIKSTPDCKTLVTASGDKTVAQWDVETQKKLVDIVAHCSSVKSVSIYDSHTIATGSRDGSIKVHDFRLKDPTPIVIRDAHRNKFIPKTPRRPLAKTDPISCVTNVVFDPNFPHIYSTGANDACIKLWDLRKITATNKPKRTRDGVILINEPNLCVQHPVKGLHCGYSHVILSGRRLFAACSDNKIYCYDKFGSGEEPIKFTGYSYNTYLKIAVMEDRFLLSGAKGGAIMWSLGNKCSSKYIPETTKQPIGQLKPDDNDELDTNVIETDWDSMSIFSFRDDRLLCKWTFQHVTDNERRKLVTEDAITSQEADVSIQMSDIINVNVLRPNLRVVNQS